jgi:ubiquinone/menaquinone biosynthesis C-methylase UbiE
MDDAQQAAEYAAADFSDAHDRFVALFRERRPARRPRRVLDLGCGPADPTRRFARAFPDCMVTGVDGAAAMLALGERANEAAGLGERISLVHAFLPDAPLPHHHYDTVLSNSLLHHLDDPAVLWQAARRFASPGGLVFVMDLLRPSDEAALRALVETHAAGAPALLRRDFERSLRAAYRPAEVAAQLDRAGLAHLVVEVVSDRHLIVHGPIDEDGGGRA